MRFSHGGLRVTPNPYMASFCQQAHPEQGKKTVCSEPQPTQLSAVLARLLQARSRQRAAQKLKANEFLIGE
jgi:hypothetical protein